jgi:hypothetical protein
MATKEQKAFAEDYLAKNPKYDVLYLNPKGEFFTDESYATNSLPRTKDGKLKGKLQKLGRLESIDKGDVKSVDKEEKEPNSDSEKPKKEDE